jgi:hypothetical protein
VLAKQQQKKANQKTETKNTRRLFADKIAVFFFLAENAPEVLSNGGPSIVASFSEY